MRLLLSAFLLGAICTPAIAEPSKTADAGTSKTSDQHGNGADITSNGNRIFGTPDSCRNGATGTAALVTAEGFRDRKGNLRIAVYNANEEEFLASGQYVERIDIPLTEDGDMTVCVPLPAAGPYAIVALHDRNKDGKLNVFSDGFGFSRNPKLGRSKPDVDKVEVDVNGISPYTIVINYVQGFGPRPWRFATRR